MSENTIDTSGMTVIQGTVGDDILIGTPGQSEWLQGLAGNDTLEGGPVDPLIPSQDLLDGGEGDDTLRAEAGSNTTMLGGEGYDLLEINPNWSNQTGAIVADGGAGDDTINVMPGGNYGMPDGTIDITGGTGNDSIVGSDKAETVHFNRGDGEDWVDLMGSMGEQDPGQVDTIRFGEGINQADLRLEQNLNGPGVQLVILDNGVDVGDRIIMGGIPTEQLEFADGTQLQLSTLAIETIGTEFDDYLYGTPGSDTIRGLAGNDTIEGGPVDPLTPSQDLLDGGEGNDTLRAEAGSNTTMLGGEGYDLLEINPNWSNQTGAIVADGGAGDDTINVMPGGNYGMPDGTIDITGGTGNDSIVGSDKAETVHFNRGDGEDWVDLMGSMGEQDPGQVDTIRFGEGINQADLRLEQNLNGPGVQLVILDNGVDVGDRIIMGGIPTEQLEFADGTQLQLSTLAIETIGTEFDDYLYGTPGSDTIRGLAGNDTIEGGPVDPLTPSQDLLDGGEGNDTLRAEAGSNTTMLGGEGYDLLEINPNWSNQTGAIVADGGAGDDTINVMPGGNYGMPDGTIDITGGTGNDSIVGSDKAETVHFNRGDGEDWVDLMGSTGEQDPGQVDTIRFGEGINQADLRLEQNLNGPGVQLVILDNGVDVGDRIIMGGIPTEQLEFADGTQLQLSTLAIETIGTEFDDYLYGTPGSDTIRGLAGNDTIEGGPVDPLIPSQDLLDGGEGNDTLRAEAGSNTTMLGGEGYDLLEINPNWSNQTGAIVADGGAGDDTINVMPGGNYGMPDGTIDITGGTGNDSIVGSDKAETVHFNRGDGEDWVDLMGSMGEQDPGQVDTIRFGEGINQADLRLEQNLNGPGVQLVILDNGVDVGDRIIMGGIPTEQLEFADGTQLQLSTLAIETIGTEFDDYLYGTPGSDTIRGLAGNDTIEGGPVDPAITSHDLLDGGEGNDTLRAEAGSNTTMLGGEGYDLLEINPNWSNQTGAIVADGGAGDDTINVTPGGNYGMPDGTIDITGGTGNDSIVGSDKAETVHFNRGDGEDWVDLMGSMGEQDPGQVDTIRFGEGINQADLRLEQNLNGPGVQLVILDNGVDVGDRIIMGGIPTEQLEFADGTQLQLSTLAIETIGTEFDDYLYGTPGSDTIRGLAGNDTIEGGPVDPLIPSQDLLDGGEGNDTLRAEAGSNTTMLGGEGYDLLEINPNWSNQTGAIVADGGAGDDTINVMPGGNYGMPDGTIDITGGTGNDSIVGSDKAETVHFNRGDGEDWVDLMGSMGEQDPGQVDTIRFGEGINQADLRLEQNLNGPGVQLVILDNGVDVGDRIIMGGIPTEQLEFADGTQLQLSTLAIETIGTEFDDYLYGTPGSDTIRGLAGNDTIEGGPVDPAITSHDLLDGGEGNDTLRAEAGSNTTMLGGEGYDLLEINPNWSNQTGAIVADGGAGDDTINVMPGGNYGMPDGTIDITGGTGNDSIVGSDKAETVHFNRGDGEDWVDLMGSTGEQDPGQVDTIRFGGGINQADLRLEQNLNGPGVQLVILDNGVDVGDRIIMGGIPTEQLEFADGTQLQLSTLAIETIGTEFDDYLYGTPGSDTIRGLAGNDTIEGGPVDPAITSHDLLDGGEGNDTLRAEAGSNTTMLGGEGYDLLEINPNWSNQTGAIVADGGAGDDTINVMPGGNYGMPDGTIDITGGTGNDSIVGSDKAETVHFNRGDGEDWVDLMGSTGEQDPGQVDTIRFGEGISLDDLRVSQVNGTGVQLFVMDEGVFTTDSILMNAFVTDYLEFSDGSTASLSDVEVVGLPSIGTDGDDFIYGTSSNDIILGGAGNDTLDAAFSGGLDKLYGEEGNDVLRTEGGASAVLDGGSGSDQIEVIEGPMGTTGVATTIIGGAGNDFVLGSSQAEVFVFNRNDGIDWINDSNGAMDPAQQDRLKFGEGISAPDLEFTANPFTQDLTISIMENGQSTGDAITLVDGQAMDGSQIELLEFSDGSIVQLTDIWLA